MKKHVEIARGAATIARQPLDADSTVGSCTEHNDGKGLYDPRFRKSVLIFGFLY